MVTMQTLLTFEGGGAGGGVGDFRAAGIFFVGISLVRIFLGQCMNIFSGFLARKNFFI